MKTCSKCKVLKPLSRFVRDRVRSDGRHPSCKDCRALYYATHRERVCAQARQYRERPGIREKISQWHKTYAERRFFYITASNLRLRSTGDSATFVELARLWKRQRGLCALTDRRLNRRNAQIDHITPHVRGGTSAVDNLRWVHRDVNYAKRDLNDAEFLQLCAEIVAKNVTRSKQRS